jgi:2-polyprenyl-3-methyl-5-hydroxy-6-metoxy-1,4-benzoquinol methylase
MKTEDKKYTERLLKTVWWKQLVNVQLPYKWHLTSLKLGYILDVGCGIGRNLINLGGWDAGVGVDHNIQSILIAKRKGLNAYSSQDFKSSRDAEIGKYDTLVVSHVLEHLTKEDALSLLNEYKPFIKFGGRILIITPQEAGFASDPTHINFMNFDEVKDVMLLADFKIDKQYSFPFPRFLGNVFHHNEFITIGKV